MNYLHVPIPLEPKPVLSDQEREAALQAQAVNTAPREPTSGQALKFAALAMLEAFEPRTPTQWVAARELLEALKRFNADPVL
jgi:hypothetical protein